MEELRLVDAEPHKEGEYTEGDKDETVTGVVFARLLLTADGDFLGVEGFIASFR